ncbi:MAG TPA: bifunctional [glutamate--ammonia ligase]-adenylyl-L-tyrosine phosphorylase/[glutamate--ammonia-ligase] adenylyltransferase, partial [Burkholderiales bacterium]
MDLLEYSRYARHVLGARPELRAEIGPAEGWTRDAMRAFLAGRPIADEASLHAALRSLRQRVVLRTMSRDLAGQAPLAEVCAAMSSLADVAVESALAFLEPELESTLGIPVAGGERQRLVVIGMGKLGGGELNVSSDVDLVFLYPEEGETSPSTSSGRSVSNLEFFTRLGRRLIAALGEATGDGFVFRVDMRLRPWGDDGPLATPFDALEEYFVTQGREWERYAWIKARALAGRDHPALAGIVRPFVFRKYLDYGAIAAMRELHAQIRAEVARRELADHIKLGPGGIREIEFIAQAFQLIRGGRDASLQARPTLEVLQLLAAKTLLPRAAVDELSEAYVFLRRLEHRLQYLDDAQTHELPGNDEDRARVARAMGFDSWDAFREDLERHRARVSWHFEQVFSVEERPRHALAPIWTAPPDDAAAKLAALGFGDAGSAAARLAAVRSGSRYGGLPQASRERFDELVPRLLEAAAAQENPDTALARGLDFAETISRRAAYLALLDEHPAVLARLALLLGASSWAAEYLNRHPVLVDELLDARTLFAAPDWSAFAQGLRRELAARAGDEERQMDWLREAHHAQVFRLLAQDLAGELTVERLADHLSDLADVMLQVTLELAWSQLRVRHRDIPRFAVIAYGKLGGKELGYGSDLDVVFLYDDTDEPDHDRAAEVYAAFV